MAQTLLPAKKRKQNVKQVFTLTRKSYYRYVAIIDDVITTGSTVNELCKVLHKEGINKIDI